MSVGAKIQRQLLLEASGETRLPASSSSSRHLQSLACGCTTPTPASIVTSLSPHSDPQKDACDYIWVCRVVQGNHPASGPDTPAWPRHQLGTGQQEGVRRPEASYRPPGPAVQGRPQSSWGYALWLRKAWDCRLPSLGEAPGLPVMGWGSPFTGCPPEIPVAPE